MPSLMLELIIYLKYNSHIWNNMNVVLAYITAREDMSTRTNETFPEDKKEDMVEETQ